MKLDPVTLLLAGLVVFFAALVTADDFFFKDDPRIFQVFAQILGTLVGALMMRITPQREATKAKDEGGGMGGDSTAR